MFPQKLDGPSYTASETNVVDSGKEEWVVYSSTATSAFPARRESPHFAVGDSGSIFMFGGRSIT